MLRAGIGHLNGVMLTHEHNDHIIGLDDVRPFNFQQWTDMPVYAHPRVQAELKRRFAYIFATENRYPGAPMVALKHLDKDSVFEWGDLQVRAIEVMHGQLPVLGFRVNDAAYITDMRTISDVQRGKLKGVKRLVVSALHHQEHHSHMNLMQALDFIEAVGPEEAFLIHISHRMGRFSDVQPDLPSGVQLAFDGLEIPL